MKVIVCGGRRWNNREITFNELDKLHRNKNITVVIEGDAQGADKLGGQWATSRGVPLEIFPANWNQYGKRAGVLRNQQMLEQRPSLVVAFPGGSGTAHMVDIARGATIPVVEFLTQPAQIAHWKDERHMNNQFNNNGPFGAQQQQQMQPQQQQMQPQQQQMQPQQQQMQQPQMQQPQQGQNFNNQQQQGQNFNNQQQQGQNFNNQQAQSMMSGFNAVSPGSGSGNWAKGGETYLFRIKEAKNGRAEQKNCELFASELEVVESTYADHPPGTPISHLVLFDNPQYIDMKQRQVKEYLAAAFGGFLENVSFESITDREWGYAVSQEQPLAGKFLRGTFTDAISKGGNQYTKAVWDVWGGPDSGHDKGPAFAAADAGFGPAVTFGNQMQGQPQQQMQGQPQQQMQGQPQQQMQGDFSNNFEPPM